MASSSSPAKRASATQLTKPALQTAISATLTIALFSGAFKPLISVGFLKSLTTLGFLLTFNGALKLRNAFLSWMAGCYPAPAYPHKDPFLGIDFFKTAVSKLRDGTVLQLFHSKLETLGRTFTYSALGTPTILTMEPENLKAILQTNFEDWPIMGPRKEALAPILGDGNIFQSNGKQWQHARAMIRPSFVRDQIADLDCFERHSVSLIKAIPRDGTTVDLAKLLFMMTMDSSSDFILGHCTNVLTTGSPETQRFNESFDYALLVSANRGRLGKLAALIPDKKFDASVKHVRQYVTSYVHQALETHKSGKNTTERKYVFLTELLKTEAPIEYICDQVLAIFLAGRDTTAATLSALFWTLARRPDVVEKLRAEINDNRKETPTWEELKSMKYLQYVIKETLRLYAPVSTNSRGAARDTILPVGGGPDGKSPVYVKKGTVCRWLLYSLHRHKGYYGDDADEFKPERWETLRPTWEFLPFNGGPRICPGQQFAITQMSLVLYKVLRQFKSIEPRDDRPLLLIPSTTLSFPNGVLVSMTPADAQE